MAVVTGAAWGIGLGIAGAFAAAGMKVVLADVREEPLELATAEVRDSGGEAIAVRTDVTQLDEVEALAAATLAEFGAGMCVQQRRRGTLHPNRRDDDRRLAVDARDRPVGPDPRRQDLSADHRTGGRGPHQLDVVDGRLLAVPRLGAYNVAKHGVVALMATLERELRAAHSPVRTSVLCPGAVNTGIIANRAQNRRQATGSADDAADSVGAIGFGAEPDDVGRLVLDAIRNDRFWIFAAPDLVASVQHQVALMAEEQSLSRLRLG